MSFSLKYPVLLAFLIVLIGNSCGSTSPSNDNTIIDDQPTREKPSRTKLSRSSTCGNMYLQAGVTPKVLTSPNYPGNYSLNTYCDWNIRANGSNRIALNIIEFDTELNYDIMQVYNSYSYTLIEQLSGHVDPQTLVSSEPQIYIGFSSDSIITDKGFQMTYQIYNDSQDLMNNSGHISLQASNNSWAYITSTNYPSNYYNNQDIVWEIKYDYGYFIELDVLEVDVANDVLRIYDNSLTYNSNANVLASYSGYSSNSSATFYSYGAFMDIRFASDSSWTASGFRVRYRAVESRPPLPTVNSTIAPPSVTQDYNSSIYDPSPSETHLHSYSYWQSIYSPNYPNDYFDNANVAWQIHNYYGSHIVLEVVSMDVENDYDEVLIFDGSNRFSPLIARLTGNSENNGYKYYSTSSYMYVLFTTDPSVTRRGFQLKYEGTYDTSSNSTTADFGATTPGGFVTTPLSSQPSNDNRYEEANYSWRYLNSTNYPYNYNNNEEITWRIYVPYYNGYYIELEILDVNLASYDYLRIFDSSGEYNQLAAYYYYSYNSSDTFFSSGSYLYITFDSDSSWTARGFQMRYRAVYSRPSQTTYSTTTVRTPDNRYEEAYSSWKYLNSTNYPYNYNNNEEITWQIESTGYYIELEILVVSLASYDYLRIFDSSGEYNQLAAYNQYSYNSSDTFYSSGSYLYITFDSDSSWTARGFQMRYREVYTRPSPQTTYYSTTTVRISGCSSSPCQNGGYCFETNSTYVCSCTAGYVGRYCESQSACSEGTVFDLMFVNDASGSIGSYDYQKSLQFMVDVATSYSTSIDSGDVRVGVVTYSSSAQISIPLGVHSIQYLINTIMNLPYYSGGTSTGDAIQLADSEFNQKSLPSTSKIMMVLTDGESGDNPKGPADDARQDGIVCMAVGVGSYDVNELLDIAGHNPSLIYEVDDFDALISFTSNITDTICAIESDLCLPNPCQNNGTCSSNGDQITCQCVNGYSGSRCEAKSCKFVPDIEHGSHHYYPNTDGHWPAEICRVQYVCDPGYQMVGYPDILCYNGKWSGSPPECLLVQCPPLTPPTNGNMTFVGDAPPNALYSIAEFTCNDGFEITEGEDYILACTTEGWSSEEPHCVPKSCEGDDQSGTRSSHNKEVIIN